MRASFFSSSFCKPSRLDFRAFALSSNSIKCCFNNLCFSSLSSCSNSYLCKKPLILFWTVCSSSISSATSFIPASSSSILSLSSLQRNLSASRDWPRDTFFKSLSVFFWRSASRFETFLPACNFVNLSFISAAFFPSSSCSSRTLFNSVSFFFLVSSKPEILSSISRQESSLILIFSFIYLPCCWNRFSLFSRFSFFPLDLL